MMTPSRFAPLCLLAAGLFVTPACARSYYGAGHAERSDVTRRAYDNGHREGLRHGDEDARRGRRFDFRRIDDYRDADEGYRREYRDRDDYRRAFRQGFEAGYTEGFNRAARGPAGARYPPPAPYPGPPAAGRPPVARSAAADIGYRDGYDAGRDDARHRRSSDPVRVKRYREGDHGYKREFGPRDDYKREYRAAFQRGYERGYRDARR